MARNLNQSIYAFIVGTAFSALLIAIFSMDSLILAIFEIPLAFIVALIVITECIYSYREEVSLQTTFDMIKPLLKTLLYSIPVVLFYSAIMLILYKLVPVFEGGLAPLFEELQGIDEIAAIPLIMFLPVFLMIFTTPFFLYAYGKVHILIWKPKEVKEEEKELKIEAREKEIEKKVFQIIDKLDHFAIQLQQYFLELQGMIPLIDSVNDHESYKTMHSRLSMMQDYVKTMEIEEDKENKNILQEEDVKRRTNEIEIQKKTILDVVQQNLKKLKSDKKQFEKEEEEEEYKEETAEEETIEEEIVEEETIEEVDEIVEEYKEETIEEEIVEEETIEEVDEIVEEIVEEKVEESQPTEEVITEEEKEEQKNE